MAYQWQAQGGGVEPIGSATIEGIANLADYNVVSGCVIAYDAADMTVDLGAGVVTHNGSAVTVAAAANGYTLVSDPSNPRWTWLGVDSSGAPAIVSGTPAAAPLVPELGDNVGIALVYVQAGLTIASNATYKLDKRVPAVPSDVYNYKTSTQVFSGSTAFADVTGASPATFTFPIGVNEVVIAEYWIPLAFGGTGGAKFQLTGPAAPTAVSITGEFGDIIPASTDTGQVQGFPVVAAFSTSFAARNSSTGTQDTYQSNASISGAFMHAYARITNGANAGNVVLQAAQNSNNSTTTLGIGSWMKVRRLG